MDKDFLVIGQWAISRKSGKLRHRLCRRWCDRFNEYNENLHDCLEEGEDFNSTYFDKDHNITYYTRTIPCLIMDLARAMRK
jgi:hypothetical protein